MTENIWIETDQDTWADRLGELTFRKVRTYATENTLGPAHSVMTHYTYEPCAVGRVEYVGDKERHYYLNQTKIDELLENAGGNTQKEVLS